ncbi:hypothetical protein SDC9_37095 [bioreactor metagenome]|jgi:hypothetical protein|uniref:DUF3822 family protein n=1 Tax=bioreactor metagenome TaxID=1076179 RepID=A0A644VI10_9ZZZZ|nr:DUF3822 family protein [Paludibacter sp.]
MHINLTDKSYSLSIRMSPDGFSLSVYSEDNKVLFSERHDTGDTDLKQLLDSVCGSLPNIQSVSLIIVTDVYTLIPAIHFDQDKAKDFLQLQHPILTDASQVLYTYYKHADAMLIYAFNKQSIKAVQNIFQQINIQHHLHQLIEEHQNITGEQVSLWIRPEKIDCLASRGNNIQLFNSYPWQTEEDIIYHVLNILHHLHFNHETTKITIYRGNDIGTHPDNTLSNYIPLINIKNIPTDI